MGEEGDWAMKWGLDRWDLCKRGELSRRMKLLACRVGLERTWVDRGLTSATDLFVEGRTRSIGAAKVEYMPSRPYRRLNVS
jgi:hypothetical protein